MMNKVIHSGIYVVINPAQQKSEMISQLEKIKEEPIAALQIWDNPDVNRLDQSFLKDVLQMFKGKTPVLINNRWELLKDFAFDGVHFDQIPKNSDEIRNEIGRDFIKGITLTNDLTIVKQAHAPHFDYLSFCAMFPSQTSGHCEIVRPETVMQCSTMTDRPIFLAGGITPDNVKRLKNLSFQGIAVVSGIMDAAHPQEAFKKYESALKK